MSRVERIKLYKKTRNKYQNAINKLPQDEIDKAIEAGYFVSGFESFPSHNVAIEKSKERVAQIDKHEMSDAFLYSLSTTLCEYRSSLFSYYYIKSMHPHEFDGSDPVTGSKEFISNYCNVCRYNNDKGYEFTFLGTTFSNFISVNIALIDKYLSGSVTWWHLYNIENCILDINQYMDMPKV